MNNNSKNNQLVPTHIIIMSTVSGFFLGCSATITLLITLNILHWNIYWPVCVLLTSATLLVTSIAMVKDWICFVQNRENKLTKKRMLKS